MWSDEENEINRCKKIIKRMKGSCDVQRNISKMVKKGIVELEEAIANILLFLLAQLAIGQKDVLATSSMEEPAAEKKQPASSPAIEDQESFEKRKEDDFCNKAEVLPRKIGNVCAKTRREKMHLFESLAQTKTS